ncbi:hypothetical protein ACPA54_20100 [Uniformispora flossi]|uniref:hypothetical protein n=1 Tax=Uniformispora flossi TaxID=3390723 RepID=UPI003C2E07EC
MGLVLLAVGVAAGVVLSRDGGSAGEDKAFCWGVIPAAAAHSVLPDGKYVAQPGVNRLDYPAGDDSCWLRRSEPETLGPWFDFQIYRKFGDLTVMPGSLGPMTSSFSGMGGDLVGLVSDYGGWVEAPPCRAGDGPAYFQLIARDLRRETLQRPDLARVPGRPDDNRVRVASVLVDAANAIRAKVGCSGPPVPQPAVQTASVAPLPTHALCGGPDAGRAFGAAPATQSRIGPGALLEECLVTDGTQRPTDNPAFRMLAYRRGLADLMKAMHTPIPDGVIKPQAFGAGVAGGVSATFTAQCTTGSVFYRAEADPARVADAAVLVDRMLRAQAAADGCPAPRA